MKKGLKLGKARIDTSDENPLPSQPSLRSPDIKRYVAATAAAVGVALLAPSAQAEEPKQVASLSTAKTDPQAIIPKKEKDHAVEIKKQEPAPEHREDSRHHHEKGSTEKHEHKKEFNADLGHRLDEQVWAGHAGVILPITDFTQNLGLGYALAIGGEGGKSKHGGKGGEGYITPIGFDVTLNLEPLVISSGFSFGIGMSHEIDEENKRSENKVFGLLETSQKIFLPVPLANEWKFSVGMSEVYKFGNPEIGVIASAGFAHDL